LIAGFIPAASPPEVMMAMPGFGEEVMEGVGK
jgi:hypothetical protein